MSKNLKVKKIKDGNFKTLTITNNDKNKKFSLRNVKTIYNKLIVKNNIKEEDIQIDLKNIQRSIQIKNFHNIYKFLNLKMIGSKYKLKSDLEIILLMIEQKFKKVKINKIIEILKKMNCHKLSNYKTLKTIKNKIEIEIKKIK